MKAAFYEDEKKMSVGACVKQEPKEDEVQVNIAYCGICGTDLHIFSGHMDARVKKPHIMGHECSGIVSAIGKDVTNVKVGDRVVVRPLGPDETCPACKLGHSHICYNMRFLGIETNGALQSFWTVPSNTIHKIPSHLSLEHAALIEPLAVACHDVKTGQVKAGEDVVVIGGGPIGMLIAMVAKHQGANVTISEISDFRLDFAKSCGFKVINPLKEDIVKKVWDDTNGKGADVVFEVTASDPGAATVTELARARGRIVVVGIYNHPPKVDLHRFFLRELRLFGARVYERDDYDKAIEIAASGELDLEKLITRVSLIDNIQEVLDEMLTSKTDMKTLIAIDELE